MRYVINGQAHNGYQIGAVATHREHRNRRLVRRLVERVLAELDAPDRAAILFANPSLLEF
jgi:predicted N-acetyltransferase YhbS